MQPGTRVVFWEDAGRMKHGSVQSIGFVDGIEVAFIVVDGHSRAPVKVPLNALSREC